MPNSTLLIDARRSPTLPELYRAVTINYQPVPRNLDGFADFLRETRVSCIVMQGCRLSIADYTLLANVCRDEGVQLHTA